MPNWEQEPEKITQLLRTADRIHGHGTISTYEPYVDVINGSECTAIRLADVVTNLLQRVIDLEREVYFLKQGEPETLQHEEVTT